MCLTVNGTVNTTTGFNPGNYFSFFTNVSFPCCMATKLDKYINKDVKLMLFIITMPYTGILMT